MEVEHHTHTHTSVLYGELVRMKKMKQFSSSNVFVFHQKRLKKKSKEIRQDKRVCVVCMCVYVCVWYTLFWLSFFWAFRTRRVRAVHVYLLHTNKMIRNEKEIHITIQLKHRDLESLFFLSNPIMDKRTKLLLDTEQSSYVVFQDNVIVIILLTPQRMVDQNSF